eukprot:3320472-Pyramimonas_sp.AAC.1
MDMDWDCPPATIKNRAGKQRQRRSARQTAIDKAKDMLNTFSLPPRVDEHADVEWHPADKSDKHCWIMFEKDRAKRRLERDAMAAGKKLRTHGSFCSGMGCDVLAMELHGIHVDH